MGNGIEQLANVDLRAANVGVRVGVQMGVTVGKGNNGTFGCLVESISPWNFYGKVENGIICREVYVNYTDGLSE